MSNEFCQKNHEGDEWSKYQLLVLQQLEDHNKVLQNLNKETADIKQSIAVHETEMKMWKTQTTDKIDQIKEDLDTILYDEKGIGHRLSNIERQANIDVQLDSKDKARWAMYGSIAIVVANALIQLVVAYLKK
jgi:hypothetical protein